MAAFYEDLWTTSQNILRALALGLGLEDEEYLLRFHTGHENELALRYYPPVKESALMREGVRRLSPHTDFDSLTLLFQDECGGLEVQKVGRKGEFFPVQPVEGALVLNIGDVLMRWSNGQYLRSLLSLPSFLSSLVIFTLFFLVFSQPDSCRFNIALY